MNRPSRLQRVIAAFTAAGLGLWPLPGFSQQTFSGEAQVVVVEVPVQVVKDGEPVRGLTAQDFEVYDGRKKVPVTGFEVLDLAAPAGATGSQPVPVSARRHFLMMFDLSFSEPKSIIKARQAAQKLVNDLHPTDLVAVATYTSLQGPQLLLGFTPDRKQIAAAIETLGAPKLVDRSPDPLKMVYSQAVANSFNEPSRPASGAGAGAEAQAAKEAALLDTLQTFASAAEHADRSAKAQMVQSLTRSFSDLARLMAEVEGRKYVVYLSEGFDSTLVSGKANLTPQSAEGAAPVQQMGDESRIIASTDASGSDSQFGDTRTQNAVEKMLEAFRRADCVIQAVDIGGLRAGNDQGVGQKGEGREALFNMAKSTGGELFENFNDLSAAMGQMLRRTGVTYVLSFQPAEDVKPDGSFHKLRVELKNAPRGSRVVARQGYYAPLPYKQQPAQAKLLEAASGLMSKDSGEITSAVLAAPFALGGPKAYVPVVIEVDGPTLLAGKQDPKLPVEVFIYALDQNGSIQDFLTQTVGLDLTKLESPLRQSGLKYFGHVDLPPGTYSLRTLVRNGTTGASSLRVTPLTVPAAGQAALLPALFQDTPGHWVPVRENPKEGKQLPYPFILKSQPYIPASRPVLTPGQESRLVLVGYNLQPGDWKTHVQVMSADGKEMPGGAFKVVDKEVGSGANPTSLLATFQPPALPPGNYALRVTLTDGAGKAETSTAQFAVGGAPGARGGR